MINNVNIHDTNGNDLLSDNYLKALVTIDSIHNSVHSGKVYSSSEFFNMTTTATHNHLINTPDTASSIIIHAFFDHSSPNGIFSFSLYESPEVTTSTALPLYNNNRNSSNTTAVKLFETSSVSTTGTLLCSESIGSGSKGGSTGTGISSFILKQNASYLVQFIAYTASLTVNHNFIFYEMTGA